MLKTIALKVTVLIFFGIMGCQAQQINDLTKMFSVAQLHEDIRVLERELKSNHPGLYTYTSPMEMDSVFNALNQSVTEGMNTMGFYRRLAVLNSVIKDSHTKVRVPRPYQRVLDDSLPCFPFSLHYDGEKLQVLRNLSRNTEIKTGWEIKEINGLSTGFLIEKLTSHISRDGYNLSTPIHAINEYFAGYYAYVFGCPEQFGITFIDLQKKPRKCIVKALGVHDIMGFWEARYPKPVKEDKPPYQLRFVDDTAILTVSTFLGEKYKRFGKPYKKAFSEVFTAIRAKRVEHLIIDVRDNLGGWPEVGDLLLSYLVSVPFKHTLNDMALVTKIENKHLYVRNGYIPHFEKIRFKKTQEGYTSGEKEPMVKPKKQLFKGKIYVLINERSASQSGEFSGLLKDRSDAIFIGQETAGNPKVLCGGNIGTLILPNTKTRIEIPFWKKTINISAKNTGRGVMPNYPIKYTLENRLSGKDEALEFALGLIGKGQE